MDARIRPEQPGDAASIHAVHVAAFPTEGEARLVDRLREAGRLSLSLVAEVEGALVGHVAFSPVQLREALDPAPDAARGSDRTTRPSPPTFAEPPPLGLAPVAVLPIHQRRGIAAALIRAGLKQARERGAPFVVVLGDPAYYSRFDFVPAARYELRDEYGGGDAFQVVETAGRVPPGGGLLQYAPEFSTLG